MSENSFDYRIINPKFFKEHPKKMSTMHKKMESYLKKMTKR